MNVAGNILGFLAWILGCAGLVAAWRTYRREIVSVLPKTQADSPGSSIFTGSFFAGLLFCLALFGVMLAVCGAYCACAYLAGVFVTYLFGRIYARAAARARSAVIHASTREPARALAPLTAGAHVLNTATMALAAATLGLFLLLPIFGGDLAASLHVFVVVLSGFAMGAAVTAGLTTGSGAARAGAEGEGFQGPGTRRFETWISAATAALIIAAYKGENVVSFASLPLVLVALSLVISMTGVRWRTLKETGDPSAALGPAGQRNGLILYTLLAIALAGILTAATGAMWPVVTAVLIGVSAGAMLGFLAGHYIGGHPIRFLPRVAAPDGEWDVPERLALSLEYMAVSMLILAVGVWTSYGTGGFYGVGISAVACLGAAGIVGGPGACQSLALAALRAGRSSSPDPKAAGALESLIPAARQPAAMFRGLGAGTMTFTALALVAAYLKITGIQIADLSLMKGAVIIGFFLGGLAPVMIASLAVLRKTGYAAAGAIAAPAVVGLALGKEALGGFLFSAMLLGVMLSVYSDVAEERRGMLQEAVWPAVESLVRLMSVSTLVIAGIL